MLDTLSSAFFSASFTRLSIPTTKSLIFPAILKDKDYYLKKVGISRTHLSNIEAIGMPTSISLELLIQIAQELDISPAYLLDSPI